MHISHSFMLHSVKSRNDVSTCNLLRPNCTCWLSQRCLWAFFFLFSLNIFISWSIFGELRHFFYGRLSGKIDWFVFFFLENFQVDDYDRIILYLYLLITKNINIYILLRLNRIDRGERCIWLTSCYSSIATWYFTLNFSDMAS